MAKSILIVDDSSMMRKMMSKTLQAGGHTIIAEAKNGGEAVERYRTFKPNLVTMDITMAPMDGLTAAREIMAEDPNACILFLSNLNENKFRKEIEEIGAVGFVNKHRAKDILALIASL